MRLARARRSGWRSPSWTPTAASRNVRAECLLGGLHVRRAGTARIGLDVEIHALAADETVEDDRIVQPVAVEEVVLAILAGDEAEAAIGYDLLDSACGHRWPPKR